MMSKQLKVPILQKTILQKSYKAVHHHSPNAKALPLLISNIYLTVTSSSNQMPTQETTPTSSITNPIRNGHRQGKPYKLGLIQTLSVIEFFYFTPHQFQENQSPTLVLLSKFQFA